MRTRNRLLLAVAAFGLALSACAGGPQGDTAAIVNGESIGVADLQILVGNQLQDSPLGRPAADEFRNADQIQRQALGGLIQDALVAGAAAELGVEVPEEAVDQEYANLAEQYGGEEALRAEIFAQSLRVQDVRRQITSLLRRDLLLEHFLGEVGDEQLRAEYDARVDTEFRVVDAAHIQVASEEEALALMDELRGGADFAELAAEHSLDEISAAGGGDLGAQPRGRFPEAFEDAVWNADAGELVGPIQTPVGWHVVRVKEFRERPLDEVSEQLRQELGGRAFQDWFIALVGDAEIRVAPRFGSWDPASGTVVPGGPLEAGPQATPTTPES